MGEDIIQDKCGFGVAHTLHDAYKMAEALQHRGRGFAGISGVSDERIDVAKWTGRVDSFDVADMYRIFPAKNHYHLFLFHVRYPTKGGKDSIINAHPHVIGGEIHERPGHIIITDCDMAIVHNGQVDEKYLEEIDKTKLKTNCDSEALLHYYAKFGERSIMEKIPGSYSMAIADKRKREVIVMRDRTGIKPGAIGWKDGKHQAASEDRAFIQNGGRSIKEMHPGSIYYFGSEGNIRREDIIKSDQKLCFFEFNYLAHHESTLNGISVNMLRNNLGEQLGLEFIARFPNEKIDSLDYLPRCPEPAARGFSRATGIQMEDIFYKMRNERAFQGPNSEEIKNSIKENLNVTADAPKILPGKTIVIIDDSIVRGNNLERARKLLYEDCKVKKVFFTSYTPPIGIIGEDKIERGCEYGVDMPPKNDNFIARDDKNKRNRTIEEISEIAQMPVFYISKEGMFSVYKKYGINPENLCTFCIGGERPF
ncbi:MAG: hypothetical protein AABW91_01405 [Nanoarchaeota archaeon]